MPERDTSDSDPALSKSSAPPTPRASGEISLGSPVRAVPQRGLGELEADASSPTSDPAASESTPFPLLPSEPGDTLLSAGKPADRLEIMLEDRLQSVDERLREFDARLTILEQKRAIRPAEPRQKPWVWIAFLIALVVVFQLLHRVR